MSAKHLVSSVLTIGAIIGAPTASAHALAGSGYDLVSGFAHPLLGVDHLLAMFAVGLWAAQQDGPDLWRLPLAFVGVLTTGIVFAGGGLPLPMVEAGIASSLLVLGLLLALALRLPPWSTLALVAVFAAVHGYAHGAEMPLSGEALPYGLGLVFGAVALLLVGTTVGRALRTLLGGAVLRLLGGSIVAAGVLLWA